MQGEVKRNTIGHFSVLAGLWFINILIVVFGLPFLIYKKAQAIFFKITKNSQSKIKTKSKPARYFPCRIDSKL